MNDAAFGKSVFVLALFVLMFSVPACRSGDGGGATFGSSPSVVESASPPAPPGSPGEGLVWRDTISGIDFVWIPPGSFMMGSPTDEIGRQHNDTDEDPLHRVTIRRGFWLGKFELTQGQWKAVTGDNPAYFKGDAHPLETVPWETVQAFMRRLNTRAGSEVYRLPTEAEWEYACRAGTSTRYSFGDDETMLPEYAWFKDNSVGWREKNGTTNPVGKKKPNPWGLHDMHGNVWEWCSDWYDENYYSRSPEVDPQGPAKGIRRSKRGAGWNYPNYRCRSADRARGKPSLGAGSVGLRVLRTAD